MIIVKLKK